MTSYLISFPRSGNHLVRFFIELLTGYPTHGCDPNPKDKPIYQNVFPETIPFNIIDKTNFCFKKYHEPPAKSADQNQKLILIVRNPKEVFIREYGKKELKVKNMNNYFALIDYYLGYSGKKLLLFYEDLLTDKEEFINTLYTFLELEDKTRLDYCLNNVDKLYFLSHNGTNRDWGKNISNGALNYYYKDLSPEFKNRFDQYLEEKYKQDNYLFLKEKYTF